MLFYHDTIIYHQAKALVTDSTLLKSIRVHLGPGSCWGFTCYAGARHIDNFLHVCG